MLRFIPLLLIGVIGFSSTAFVEAQQFQDKSPTAKEIRPFIDTYVNANTSGEERAKAALSIASCDKKEISGAFKQFMKNGKDIDAALALATQLRTPELSKDVLKSIQANHSTAVLNYLLTLQEPGIADKLIGEWKKAEQSGSLFASLQHAFEIHAIRDISRFKEFKTFLKDKERASQAASVLQHQLGIETSDPTEILDQWPELEKTFTFQGKTFSLKGVDLLRLPFQSSNVELIGPNVRMEKTSGMIALGDDGSFTFIDSVPGQGGQKVDEKQSALAQQIQALPWHFQNGNFELYCRVLLLDGGTAGISISNVGCGNCPYLQTDGETWRTCGSYSKPTAQKAVHNEWLEIRITGTGFHYEKANSGEQLAARTVKYYVNGKELPGLGFDTFNQLTGICFSGQNCVWGGVELRE